MSCPVHRVPEALNEHGRQGDRNSLVFNRRGPHRLLVASIEDGVIGGQGFLLHVSLRFRKLTFLGQAAALDCRGEDPPDSDASLRSDEALPFCLS